MAVIKQACPKCGQRVSGDESFYGTSVDCPVCTAKIFFPEPDQKVNPTKDSARESESDGASRPIPSKEQDVSKDPKDQHDLVETKSDATQRQAQDEAPKVKVSRSLPSTHQGYAVPPSPTLSIISMVLGILNAVTFCLPSVVLAPAAIICGHIALIKGKFSPIQPAPGRSMAITGLILGYVGMVVMLITLMLAVFGFVNVPEWLRGTAAER